MELNAAMEWEWPEIEIAVRLGVATLMGMALGLDREVRGYDAGLRTHGLVALSSAVMTVSALLLYYQLGGAHSRLDPLRVVEGMAAAMGIIAAGLIIVRGDNVQNLTSAAHIWLTATLGIACGAGQYPVVLIGGGIALVLLVLVGVAERWIPEKTDERF